jgi:hypothetical protein
MKKSSCFFCLLFFLGTGCQPNKPSQEGHQHLQPEESAVSSPDTLRKSIPGETHGQVGGVHVAINYTAPAVRGRVIWGGLVPFDEVWVTGAHNATSVSFSKDVEINGVEIPQGKYGFFTIPGKDTWVIILNRNWDQHLTDDYDPGEDLLRVNVTPETGLPMTERLTYGIEEKAKDRGAVTMQWENLGISLPFRIK